MEDFIILFVIGGIVVIIAIIAAFVAGNSQQKDRGGPLFGAVVFSILAVTIFTIGAVQFRADSPTGHPQESLSFGVYKLEGSPQAYTEDDGTEFILFFTERDDNNVNAFRIRAEQALDPVCAEAEFLEVRDNSQEQRIYRFFGCDEPVSLNENPEVLEP